MKKLLFSLLFVFITRLVAFAGEGMWIPLLLALLNEKEMKSMGMRMSAEDIYSVNKSSLKDAIVHFNGGCTASVISPKGLLLTNHHCGYGQIQAHSTLEHNYLEDGFWAASMKEELPNPGVTVTFISRIEDVTQQALAGVTDEMDKRTRQSVIDQNLERIRQNAMKESWEDVLIRPFFHGNQYFMFITVTYRDVRLVGAPPSSIGKFGADTDNWVWPRHTGDFSLFRIYADKNNRPADYSPDNVPYRPRHFLPVSIDGVQDGDFTLVFGFPGRTYEYLPAAAIRQIVDVLDPAKIAVRDKTLAIWDSAMRADPEVKIQYASKQASLANAWKKWQGEVLGLRRTRAVDAKLAYEAEFRKVVSLDPKLNARYGTLLDELESLYAQIEPHALRKTFYDEITFRNVEILRLAGQINRLLAAHENNGEEGFQNFRQRLLSWLESYYKDYQPELDRQVFAAQMALLHKKMEPEFLPPQFFEQLQANGNDFDTWAKTLFSQSWLTNPDQAISTLTMSSSDVLKAITNDPACRLAAAFESLYNERIMPPYNELDERIDDLQQRYMKAQMEAFPNRRFYPDANGTMRCSYGRVQGYRPRDAVAYMSKTYLEGVMEKYIPGDYEFDVPEKLRKLYEKKDYGVYGEGGRMPVCFIASNHTTGGNSGSPAIDAYGNLIGLNFDRVWEGTMSDYYFDEKLCRNIMVDVRYILFIIDKYAGATHLVREMKLVHPKAKDGRKGRAARFKEAEKQSIKEE